MENNTTYASTSYRTEKAMVIAMLADFVSAGGQNGRTEVEGFLADWKSTLAEYNTECRDYHEEHQEAAFAYFVDRREEITATDILDALYGNE